MYIEKDQLAKGGFRVVQKARTRDGKMFVKFYTPRVVAGGNQLQFEIEGIPVNPLIDTGSSEPST